jgi:hypothetical protein
VVFAPDRSWSAVTVGETGKVFAAGPAFDGLSIGLDFG